MHDIASSRYRHFNEIPAEMLDFRDILIDHQMTKADTIFKKILIEIRIMDCIYSIHTGCDTAMHSKSKLLLLL